MYHLVFTCSYFIEKCYIYLFFAVYIPTSPVYKLMFIYTFAFPLYKVPYFNVLSQNKMEFFPVLDSEDQNMSVR